MAVSRDSSIWQVTPRVEKAPLSAARSSFQLILWPATDHKEPNKQRGIDGQSVGPETARQDMKYFATTYPGK